MCREQPFDTHTDEEVIDNCGHYYRADGLETLPPYPSTAPKEIYDLMCECWNRDEVHRPAFREIHMFLQRKNMGYDPRDDFRLASASRGAGAATLSRDEYHVGGASSRSPLPIV